MLCSTKVQTKNFVVKRSRPNVVQHLILTFLLHNIGFRTVYYTTLGFDHCTTQYWFWPFTTQHLILTFLLHNIWFRPFYYTTLGFDRFIIPDSIWPVYCTTCGLDLFTTQLCVGQCTTKPFVVRQCITKPLFTAQHLVLAFLLHNSV